MKLSSNYLFHSTCDFCPLVGKIDETHLETTHSLPLKINNILRKHRILSLHVQTNYEYIQMITTKFRRYPPGVSFTCDLNLPRNF
jgi:hypothetical protein